jgi:hypothetical protein
MHGTITVTPPPPTVNTATNPVSGSNQTNPTISGTAPDNAGVNVYEGPGCATLIDDTTTADGTGHWSYTVSDAHSLVSGNPVTFFAKTRIGDALSDCSSTSASYTPGTGGPVITLTDGPGSGAVIVNPSPRWDFTATNSTFVCSVSGSTFAFSTCTGTFTPAAALASGNWTFAIRATDTTGNETLDVFPFTVDLTDPAIHGPRTTRSRKPKFTLTRNAAIVSYECEFDAKGFVPATTGASGPFCKAARLRPGRHTLTAHAIDALGETGPNQVKRFKITR